MSEATPKPAVPESEILLVDKPYRWTSFDAVGAIRGTLRHITGNKKIKIGHAGTLDPLATGLLILCIGKATKRIEEFMDFDKEYSGTFVLGATTASYDLEKEVQEGGKIDHLNDEQIQRAAQALTGNIMQVPPVFSAIKVDGKRAYESARRNKELQLEARPVRISRFEIMRIEMPEVDFVIECSKGTYIRSIARDLGEMLQCGAYLSALRRTRIGPYRIQDALTIDQTKDFLRQRADLTEQQFNPASGNTMS